MASEDRAYHDPTSRTGIANDLYAVEFGIASVASVLTPIEVGGGIYLFTVPDDQLHYTVYEKAGANPALGDPWLAILEANLPHFTVAELTAIRTILGLPASGSTPLIPTSGVLAEIVEKTNLIFPGSFFVLPSVVSEASVINVTTYVGETEGPSIPLSQNYTAQSLIVVWEPNSKTNITLVGEASGSDISITSSAIKVLNIPTAVYSEVRKLKYSVRYLNNKNKVIVEGTWDIRSAALKRT